ncbi:hypothetical protein ACSAZL_19265 [Methanosarcina sp. T3]
MDKRAKVLERLGIKKEEDEEKIKEEDEEKIKEEEDKEKIRSQSCSIA